MRGLAGAALLIAVLVYGWERSGTAHMMLVAVMVTLGLLLILLEGASGDKPDG